jgi:hypothetical protein
VAHDCRITAALLRQQQTVFRLAGTQGVTHKLIHHETGLSLSVIGQYARGETAVSGPSLIKLFGVIPDSLLSLLLPDGRAIVRVPTDVDFDDVEAACRDFLATKGASHHPDSPDQRDVSSCEEEALGVKVVQLRGTVRA